MDITRPIAPVELAEGADPRGEPLVDDTGLPRRRTSERARRAEKHRRVLALGYHPAGLAFGLSVRLHQLAAPAGDPDADGLRCGTCVFRREVPELEWRGRKHHKCTAAPHAYVPAPPWMARTAGKGPDIPSDWPACTDYAPAPADDGAPDGAPEGAPTP